MLPWQLMPSMVARLAKPTSGERPICLENMSIRLFMRLYSAYGQAWAVDHHGFWDDAIQGSSALTTGFLRGLLDESAIALGFHTATAHWDLNKCYDSTHLPSLIRKGLELDYDAAPLYFCVLTYLGPRVLQAGG